MFSHDFQTLLAGSGQVDFVIPPEGRIKDGKVIFLIVDVKNTVLMIYYYP